MYRMLSLLFFIGTSARAQVTISGKITDAKNKPLAGISITLKDTYDGSTSDSSGHYSFATTERGQKIIQASAIGFKPFEQAIDIDQSPVTFNIQLKELVTELKAVVISAGTFEASDQKRTTVLNPIDIVTTASANADITSAIKTLPGTQQVGETEGLFVRGGTAGESKTFIDGTLVNNFYYSSQPQLAQRGRFNPFIFKGTIFSAGGYSALYGQALSSVLVLESVDLPEQSSADFALSYLAAGAGIQKVSKKKKASWGISYDYTNLELAFKLVKQKQEYFRIPELHNMDANFRIKTSSTGIIKYYGMLAGTNVGFRYADIDSAGMKDAFRLRNTNIYHNLSWKEKIGGGWKLNAGFSYSTNRDRITNEFQDAANVKQSLSNPLFASKNFALTTHGEYANGKLVFEKRLHGLSTFKFGSEYNYSNDKLDFTANNTTNSEAVKENLLSVFSEADLYITNEIAARIGARAEHSALLDKWNMAPRLSLAYKFPDNSQASVAYGIFYQDPERKYLPGAAHLQFSRAAQYIIQYQKISNSRTLRTELFYKKYNDLIKTSVYYGKERAINNNGYGDAKGFELFWRDKKTIRNVDYWISYSYLDTKRDFLNYPSLIEPPFAAKHTASLVAKKFVTGIKTQFNASWTFATGRPYYDIRPDNNGYRIFTHGTVKDYNSMSFSANYLPNIGQQKAKHFSIFVFSVNNVLGTNNIYTYNFSTNGKISPVTPPSKRFYYVGWFVSFGIDRSESTINNLVL